MTNRRKNVLRQTLSLMLAMILSLGVLTFSPMKAHAEGETMKNAVSIQLDKSRNYDIEPNDDPASTLTLSRGSLHRGYVGGKNEDGTFDQRDFWAFEAEAGHYYRMVFTQQGINGTDVKAYVTQPGAKINDKTPLTCQRRTKDGHLFVDVPIETSDTAYLMFSYNGERTPYAIRLFDLTDGNLVAEKGRWNYKNGKWYYLDDSGIMLNGWRDIDGKRYFFDLTNGAMMTGWQQIDSKWYYLDSSGAMVTGKKYIGNRYYTFNSSGVWVE